MKYIEIHQFSPSAHRGDGITNGMFYLQRILQELGFVSHIYAENIDKELDDEVLHYSKLKADNENQLLFVHYSIYYDFDRWINALVMQKIMIYHNITPYTFFEKGSFLYDMCKSGKEYLPELASKVVGAIGDSTLNSEELKEHHFKNVTTIPLLMDLQNIQNRPYNKELFDATAEEFTIIFVGRIARNKAQHDLIEVANIYQHMCKDFKMYIIGSTTDANYKEELQTLINSYELQNNVILSGKISDADLYAYYRSADLFLCMSEHEGFGIPLIESMLFDLPVMAYNSSNIKSTLNKGGILFDEKSYKHIAATIKLLRENVALRSEVLKTQRKAITIYEHQNIVKKLLHYLENFGITANYKIEEKKEKPLYQFEGPFDSSYSLAILNRHTALAFEKKYPDRVALFSTEGYGDFTSKSTFLEAHPLVKKLAQKSEKALQCKVVLRNLYPPRVTGMKGEINLLNAYGWEESAFPKKYVEEFNENLNGITVMSEYVKKLLKNNGVRLPIAVVGLGAEHIKTLTPCSVAIKSEKKFKFLHISSCFARKGIDVLLAAYCETFTDEDDVTLIIKTFVNPHNNIEEQIKTLQAKYTNIPEIILLNEDFSDAHIAWLYQTADALVAPSRGEGFGLPMAEAMLFHLPVITTGYGGQTDFCREDTAWLCDYTFQKAQTHMELFNSYWAEPDKADLARLLKEQLTLSKEEKKRKTERAYALISQEFTWDCYREKTENFIESLENRAIFDTSFKKIAWISSYNTKCGIATYSDFILSNLDYTKLSVTKFANHTELFIDETKEYNVVRCWGNRFDQDNKALIEAVLEGEYTDAVINFNFGFFSMKNLAEILEQFFDAGIQTTIIFHSVEDVTIEGLESSLSWIKESLKKVDHLLVHTIDDLNRLKAYGFSNFDLLPHGVQNRSDKQRIEKKELPDTLASYGFLLPHKGILELIEAFALLHKKLPYLKLLLVNALYPVAESQHYLQRCQKRVELLGLSKSVTFYSNYLADEDSFTLLDKADLLILPYRATQESSSAAVRYAVSTYKPVVCTDEAIFNDVRDIVHFTEGNTPQAMADSIEKLLQEPQRLYEKSELQKRWIEEHDWKNIALKIQDL